MSHKEQRDWFERMKRAAPNFFKGGRILEIGSLNVNGTIRDLFERPVEYVGVDLGEGTGVDVICKGHLYDSPIPFDVVVSTESLEHDMLWEKTLANMVRLLRPGGLMLLTCATTGRKEHGTLRSDPGSAPLLKGESVEWANYYRNLTVENLSSVLKPKQTFVNHLYRTNQKACDLYFWGIKR